MKKVIWISFVVLALIWTALAFAASGLARWTSDAIASERLAQAAGQVVSKAETVTRSVTNTLTDASGQLAQPVGAAIAGAAQQSVDAAKSAAAVAGATAGAAAGAVAASVPPMPPMPAWVDQLLGPEWVQSIKEWGAWAKAAAGVSGTYVANAAKSSTSSDAPQAAATTNQSAASTATSSVAAVTPWLASLVGWLVPIVWIIWGIGLLIGFVVTLIAQGLIGRFFGGGSRHPPSAQS
jgi:hypothetical protein